MKRSQDTGIICTPRELQLTKLEVEGDLPFLEDYFAFITTGTGAFIFVSPIGRALANSDNAEGRVPTFAL